MRGRESREGAVLIIVLLVIAAAAFLILESGKYLRIDYEGAAGQRLQASGGSLLHAGLVVASELLLYDLRHGGATQDSRFDNWAKADNLYDQLSRGLDSGELHGEITAEDGLIDLDSMRRTDDEGKAQRQILVRLLSGLLSAHDIEGDPNAFLTSIQIWMGAKDTQNDAAWYAARDPGYERRSDNFVTPEELRLVRWKGLSDEDRLRVIDGGDGVPGLLDFVTLWSDGKINMNVAPREVLAAVCPSWDLRGDFVKAVEEYRADGSHQLSGTWYKDVADRVGVAKDFPENALGYQSMYFRVSLVATVGAATIRSTTIVKRNTQHVVVLLENIH